MVLVGSVLHGQLLVASLRTHVRRTSSRGHTRANSRILGFSSSLDTGLARRATPLDPLRAAANLRSCAVRIHDVGGRLGCSPPFSRLTPPPRDPGVGGCLDRKRFLVRILARFDRGNASGSNPGSARGRHALSMGTDEPVGWVPGLSLPPTAGDRPRGIDRYLVRKISMMSPRISMVGPARDLSIHPGPRSPPLERGRRRGRGGGDPRRSQPFSGPFSTGFEGTFSTRSTSCRRGVWGYERPPGDKHPGLTSAFRFGIVRPFSYRIEGLTPPAAPTRRLRIHPTSPPRAGGACARTHGSGRSPFVSRWTLEPVRGAAGAAGRTGGRSDGEKEETCLRMRRETFVQERVD